MKQDDQNDLRRSSRAADNDTGSSLLPPLELDAEQFLPDLDGFDLSEAEKLALLQTLWEIMRAFVEMGVDVGREDICGRILGDENVDPNHSMDDVKSSFSKATETNSHYRRKEPTA